jgi:hypothetical protein
MLRPVRRPLVALVAAALALGACGGGPSDEQQVRSAVEAFGNATAAKDYQRLCDLLSPRLIQKIRSTGLPCEVALEKGLASVKDPKLTIGQVAVKGDDATADIRTSATGQKPARTTLKLTKVAGQWRIASLS